MNDEKALQIIKEAIKKNETVLDLSGNKLTALPTEITQLKGLATLNLSYNHLTTLPEEISELKSLTELDLFNNRLTELPKEISELKSLTKLNLSYNKLTTLPKEISKLKSLTKLNLSYNKLTTLPKEISELKSLIGLYLSGNQLPVLPDVLGRYDEPAIIIDSYLSAIGGQPRPLNEVKVLIVGETKVGKTSLMKILMNGQQAFNPNESQIHEINIQTWKVPIDGEVINLNLWDFGSQEIDCPIYRVFLTECSLYILVLNCRDSEEQNRLEYWLKIIQSYGGNSPVIIVGNHADQLLQVDQQPFHIRHSDLRDKYPNIKKIVETSCEKYSGIEELKAEIIEIVSEMRRVQDPLPVAWFQVKKKLKAMQSRYAYISYNNFLQMCIEEKILNEDEQKALLATMHILGVALNYRDDPSLTILNPLWITKGVYGIITNSKILTKDNGMLEREKLKGILDQAKYPESSHPLLLNMMCRLELCFPTEGGKRYLIPDLLRDGEIDTGDWSDSLKFRYDYKILPQSIIYNYKALHQLIISHFIVRASNHISKETYWRYGVKLAREGNYALVKADKEEGKIFILINGSANTRRNFLSIIRPIFEDIHRDFSNDFEVEEGTPLPDYPDEVVPYQDLRNLEKAGADTGRIRLQNGILFSYQVKLLLDGIQTVEDRMKEGSSEERLRLDKNIAYQSLETGPAEVIKSENSEIKEKVKLGLDEKARKYAGNVLRLIFFLFVIVYLIIGVLLYKVDWGPIEPWTYYVGIGIPLLLFGYFVFTLKEFSPRGFHQKLVLSKKKKLYEELYLEFEEELTSRDK